MRFFQPPDQHKQPREEHQAALIHLAEHGQPIRLSEERQRHAGRNQSAGRCGDLQIERMGQRNMHHEQTDRSAESDQSHARHLRVQRIVVQHLDFANGISGQRGVRIAQPAAIDAIENSQQ